MRNRLTIWLARQMENRALRVIAARPPDFVIGDPADPYMLRWWLLPRNPVFNVYLHVFRHDDDDRALHDHPWPSVSIMLAGEASEVYAHRGEERRRGIAPGSVVFRGPRLAHRMEVRPGPKPMTIFVTGPRVREWGFHCPKGWVHWRHFTSPADKGRIGRGCE